MSTQSRVRSTFMLGLPAAAPTNAIAKPSALVLSITLLVILLLNFGLRAKLDRADAHIVSFFELLDQNNPGFTDAVRSLPWWKWFLPLQLNTGSWSTTGLLLCFGLEQVMGGATNVYYFTNAVMVATGFLLSWCAFRSYVFSVTFAGTLAFSTWNIHTYSCPGTVMLPLVISYMFCFLFCQFKLLQPGCRDAVWIPLGIASILVFALSYESWLDCVVFLWCAYAFILLAARRQKADVLFGRALAVIAAITGTALLYVFLKVTLGYGQGDGSESDVVFNYGRQYSLLAIEDVLVHYCTLFFITVTHYLPPIFFNYSLSSWFYGTQKIVELQHGYHSDQMPLIGQSHLFLWRFYAGFFLAGFVWLFCRSAKVAWTKPTTTSVAAFLFILMTMVVGPTHILVKMRPMHAAPFLGYHCWLGITGLGLLISLGTQWIYEHMSRRWLALFLVAVIWGNLAVCAVTRPSLLSHMSQQCGLGAYPDPVQNLKETLRTLRSSHSQ